MEFIKTDINFSDTIALWALNDFDYLKAGGKITDTKEMRRIYSKMIYAFGDVYKIIDTTPLGFLFIERNKTFHIFTIRKTHSRKLLNNVFDFCFKVLKYDKVFTMTDDRMARAFNRGKLMTQEKYKRIGYNVFSKEYK